MSKISYTLKCVERPARAVQTFETLMSDQSKQYCGRIVKGCMNDGEIASGARVRMKL